MKRTKIVPSTLHPEALNSLLDYNSMVRVSNSERFDQKAKKITNHIKFCKDKLEILDLSEEKEIDNKAKQYFEERLKLLQKSNNKSEKRLTMTQLLKNIKGNMNNNSKFKFSLIHKLLNKKEFSLKKFNNDLKTGNFNFLTNIVNSKSKDLKKSPRKENSTTTKCRLKGKIPIKKVFKIQHKDSKLNNIKPRSLVKVTDHNIRKTKQKLEPLELSSREMFNTINATGSILSTESMENTITNTEGIISSSRINFDNLSIKTRDKKSKHITCYNEKEGNNTYKRTSRNVYHNSTNRISDLTLSKLNKQTIPNFMQTMDKINKMGSFFSSTINASMSQTRINLQKIEKKKDEEYWMRNYNLFPKFPNIFIYGDKNKGKYLSNKVLDEYEVLSKLDELAVFNAEDLIRERFRMKKQKDPLFVYKTLQSKGHQKVRYILDKTMYKKNLMLAHFKSKEQSA